MEASPMGALGDPVRLKKDVKVVLLPKKVLRKTADGVNKG
jgi:hypothetical protein